MNGKKKCAHEGCDNTVWAMSVAGVCRQHMHRQGCGCGWCKPMDGRRVRLRYRLKTRAELVAEGLLPEGPILTYERTLK